MKRKVSNTKSNNVKKGNKVSNTKKGNSVKKSNKQVAKELPEGWEMEFDEATGRFNLSFPIDPQESERGTSMILAKANGKINIPVEMQDEDGNDLEVSFYGLGVYAKPVEE